ncbi:MAG: hypothetical protein ACJ76H_06935 [Bacteriovoracaceae bacterium]
MTDKFEEFMKQHAPQPAAALKTLELPRKKSWIVGVAASGLLAASLTLVVVNQRVKYESLVQAEESLDASFDDEFPTEYQEVENALEDLY